VLACSSAAPIFISAAKLRTSTATRYEYDAVASGVPAPSYLLLEGPAGLKVHPDTGRVSWPAPVSGSHTVRILATNPNGDVTQAYTLQVD
jgi:hypothetical protein